MTDTQSKKLFFQPQNPAYWMYMIFLGYGIYVFGNQVAHVFSAYLGFSLFALLLWGIYTIPWFFFIGHEELYDRQPVPVALSGFLWGGLIATFVMALEANTAIIGLLGKLVSVEFARDWGASVSAPFVEELAKGLGIVTLVLLAKDRFRSIYDGTVIGAFTGLGFQVFEDLIYTFSAADLTSSGDEWQAVLSTFLGRGIVSGLWSHAMYSALVGAGIAAFVINKEKPFFRRLLRPAIYITMAWGAHFIWDSPWVNGLHATPFSLVVKLALYPVLFSIGLFFAFRRKRSELSAVLDREVEMGTLSRDDADAVGASGHSRRRVRAQLHKQNRSVSRKDIHKLQKAQRRLAVSLIRSPESSELIKEKREAVGALSLITVK